MHRIRICFRDTEFEHDIFELIRAFWPEAVFTIHYDDTEESGEEEAPDLSFTVFRTEKEYCIEQSEGERKLIRVPVVEGQSADGQNALLSCAANPRPADAGERVRRHALRKEQKDLLKTELYGYLAEQSGRTLPWGDLTGIRPVKLVMGMLDEGMTNPEAAAAMRDRYKVSTKKAALAVAIANRERDILKGIDFDHGLSLYAGIPFCPSICLYCSFSSYPLKIWEKRVDEYLDALCREARETAEMIRDTGREMHSIYIGGGTPTTLSPDQLRRLLDTLTGLFWEKGVREFTVEAGRPDSITADKLKAIREFPVTRISVNPQTMNQETLDLIGRRHTVEQAEKAYFLARECGFDNINMDLIVGLPGETRPMVEHTLERMEELSPDSLTVHSLAVKRAARLNIFKDEYSEMTFENNQEILDLTMQSAYRMGMSPYYLYRQKNMKGNFENVGYAKVDKAGIYNILIMEEKEPILALGAGGASKFVLPQENRIERVENVKDVASYIERIDEMIGRKRTGIRKWL